MKQLKQMLIDMLSLTDYSKDEAIEIINTSEIVINGNVIKIIKNLQLLYTFQVIETEKLIEIK